MSGSICSTSPQGLQGEQQKVFSAAPITNACVPAFQFSVLTNYRKLLTKTIHPDNRAEPCYAMNFKYTYHELDTLDEIARALGWLAPEQHRCIIRGQLKAELNSSAWHRRLMRESYNKYTDRVDQATIECGKRRWIPIDGDGVPVPMGLGAPDKLVEAGYYVRDERLPHIFRGIRCVVTATSKTGLLGGDIAYLRLFFMLAEAADNDLLRVWLEKLNLEHSFIDASVCDPEHIIYTARPKFVDRQDPVPEWGQVRVLDGFDETISPDLPRECKSKRLSRRHPVVLGNVSDEWLALTDQYAGRGIHPIEPPAEPSPRAWMAIRRIFDMLEGCGRFPKVGKQGRHATLTRVAYELACLVAEGEVPEIVAREAYWKAAEGINNSDGKYDAAAIERRLDDAFLDVCGSL